MENHKRVMVKTLLDSSATGMFVDRNFMEEHGFELEKLDRLVNITNIDNTNNSEGKVMHKIECNVFFKRHKKRIKMDVGNLGRTKVVLDML